MKLSIIVPVYKTEKYLQRCLDSIKNQQYKDFECILVDDGSPDNCPAICDDYAKEDARFKVIHKENGGLVSAWKKGLEESKGEYIGFVDSDDWIDLDMYSSMMEKVEEYNLDCCICSFKYVFENSGKIEPVEFGIDDGFYSNNNIGIIYDGLMPKLSKKNYIPGARWCKIFKREILCNIAKNYNVVVNIAEDTMLTHPALLECNRVYFLKKNFYNYFRNDASMMGKYNPEYLEDWYITTNIYEPYRNKFSYDTAIEEAKYDFLIRNVINFIIRSNLSFSEKRRFLLIANKDDRVKKVLKDVKNIKMRNYYKKMYFVLTHNLITLSLIFISIKKWIK